MGDEIALKKKSENIWEIPKSDKMLVPALIYASEALIEKIKEDKTLEQARNVAHLKGIQKASYVMPDAHQGYGFPIGGVAAFDMEEGIISPGGVGYDINCGVRLLRTDFTLKQIKEKRKELLDALAKAVPPGVGRGGQIKLTKDELLDVLKKGSNWALEKGYASEDDLKRTEENGCLDGADPSAVSPRAISRGLPQVGTLGAGNHFLELQAVEEIYDKEIAKTFGFEKKGQVAVMIHCGSRGLGHQIASDYIKLMENKFGHAHLPDRELINAPIKSDLGKKYYKAMACACNFAFANRQIIAHWVKDAFKNVMGTSDGMDLVYDVCHNIAKFEEHEVNGEKKQLCIHRKGATRAFGPGRIEIPEVYRKVGQPVIIPGSMGTASYLLVGTKKAEEISWGSTAHGAGRVASRAWAIKHYRGEEVKKKLEQKDIEVKAGSWKGLAEESPQVYKDIDEVIRVSDELGLAKKIVKLIPIGVMKG